MLAAQATLAIFVAVPVSAATINGRQAAVGACASSDGSVPECRQEVNEIRQIHVIKGVSFYYQDKPLSCEEASTSMALTHQGIHLSQDEILNEVGADVRPMYVDSAGDVRWANPYETFVGDVNGSESNYTGFGTYYPTLVRVAKAHGARLLAYGTMPAASIYADVIEGHPVVAFATWDWQWHPRHDYLSFDGQWIPWIGPVYASHVYVVVGVSPTDVLINDPIRGQYWISKQAFEAGYSDFNEAIVFA
ncbi:MAG TPA: C39 family peptidase [Candidatus Dormibacteraeota bacterium]|nr:C39 family peptidase [Candidatus Dormibacteraeota bacterium]